MLYVESSNKNTSFNSPGFSPLVSVGLHSGVTSECFQSLKNLQAIQPSGDSSALSVRGAAAAFSALPLPLPGCAPSRGSGRVSTAGPRELSFGREILFGCCSLE